MTSPEAAGHLPAFVERMKSEGLQPLVIETFAHYYRKVVSGETGLIYDREIQPVKPDEIADIETLHQYCAAGRQANDHAIRIVLNGGLGTTMGLSGPKSLIEAKNGKTFLEIILKQDEQSRGQLALMNSFNTHEATLAALSRIKPARLPLHFIQHRFPKIRQQDLAPASWPENPALEWNPPGHGDVFTALNTSGMLEHLLENGIEYAFVHNLDNLGARMEESLLGYFAERRFAFMMEVAEKTPADIKGGHLARYHNGRLVLREAAQCPKEETEAFRDIKRYRYFNTNNIWINLKSLKTLFDREKTIHLPMILNPKTVDPRNRSSPPVFQIETAMGAAISLFEDTTAVRVPRSRFFPVKSCNELLGLRSDCYVLEEKGHLSVNPKRLSSGRADTIKIRLDPKFYGRIDLMEDRFKEGIPSLVDCNAFDVEGDVYFEGDVTIKDTVSIKNSHPSPAIIKKGSVLEGDIVF